MSALIELSFVVEGDESGDRGFRFKSPCVPRVGEHVIAGDARWIVLGVHHQFRSNGFLANDLTMVVIEVRPDR